MGGGIKRQTEPPAGLVGGGIKELKQEKEREAQEHDRKKKESEDWRYC